jgi:hypothetical protein
MNHVYSKPTGHYAQEAAGLNVCLLAFAECVGIDLAHETSREVTRIHKIPIDHFRERHQAKARAGVALFLSGTEKDD